MSNLAAALLNIIGPIQEDLNKVNEFVSKDLDSDIELLQRISHHVISAGGKRVRPIILLLIARALGYKGDGHVFLAAMIEYVHTSSLLHDDVVDESDLRRGKPTASFKWGNAAAVLAGDFMYSRAFQMMVKTGNLRICEIVADAVNRVSEGELIQLLNIRDTTVDQERYLEVIERKTGVLFEAAARMAAVIAGADKETEERVADYALALGRAFQIVDDVLDYTGTAEIGKNRGGDLKEGKLTMPIIYALRHGTEEESETLRHAILQSDVEFQKVLDILEKTWAIDACMQLARDEVNLAIEKISALPPSIYKNSLIEFVSLSVMRTN
jgi:octaprenyl-diphosphate synthase